MLLVPNTFVCQEPDTTEPKPPGAERDDLGERRNGAPHHRGVCRRLWHEPLNAPQLTMVAAGTLDDPSWAIPVAHIWTSRAAPSANIPAGVLSFEKGPADRAELIAAFEKIYPRPTA